MKQFECTVLSVGIGVGELHVVALPGSADPGAEPNVEEPGEECNSVNNVNACVHTYIEVCRCV